jgi:hypothetical protein
MNERTKELWAKCVIKHANDPMNWQTVADGFAELIIRECMSICDVEKADYDKYRKGAWDFDEKNIYSEGAAACDTIKHKMKHRFGVK